jgi:DNA repair exonuclease SbcCD nuclease subunit
MEWVFEKFGELDMPVYYIYGNHDRQERGSYIGGQKYSEEELEKAILDSGIIILMDDRVKGKIAPGEKQKTAEDQQGREEQGYAEYDAFGPHSAVLYLTITATQPEYCNTGSKNTPLPYGAGTAFQRYFNDTSSVVLQCSTEILLKNY